MLIHCNKIFIGFTKRLCLVGGMDLRGWYKDERVVWINGWMVRFEAI